MVSVTPRLGTTKRINMNIRPRTMITNMVTNFTRGINKITRAPIAHRIRASPLKLMTGARINVRYHIINHATLQRLLLSLISGTCILTRQDTNAYNGKGSTFSTLLMSRNNSYIPVPIRVRKVTFCATYLNVMHRDPYRAIRHIHPDRISIRACLHISYFWTRPLIMQETRTKVSPYGIRQVTIINRYRRFNRSQLFHISLMA